MSDSNLIVSKSPIDSMIDRSVKIFSVFGPRAILVALVGLFSPSLAAPDEIATTKIYVNEASATNYARINCGAPAWTHGYPCRGGDGAIEVDALLHRIENYLATEDVCRGLSFGTTAHVGEFGQYWELEVHINFVDENASPEWLLWRPGKSVVLAGKGNDQPSEIARLVCGIVSHKGARSVD